MGTTLIRLKIMPESPDVNFEEIKSKVKEIVEKGKGEKVVFEEEPIAFGLKALIVGFAQDEEGGELEPIENSLNDLDGVSSVEVVDMRRAFG